MARTGKRAGEQDWGGALTTLTQQYPAEICQPDFEPNVALRDPGLGVPSEAARGSMLALARLLGKSAALTFRNAAPVPDNSLTLRQLPDEAAQ